MGCSEEALTAASSAAEQATSPSPHAVEDEEEPLEMAASAEGTDPSASSSARWGEVRRLRQSEPERVRQAAQRACDDGVMDACVVGAEMMERGEGGEAQPEQARSLYQQACFEGVSLACDRLGH